MRLVALVVFLAVACACTAAAAGRVHVATVGKLTTPTVGRAWTLRLAVRPASFSGTVRVTASGPTRLDVKASGRRGSYRARLVFPSRGRWNLTARAGASTSRLGAVSVLPALPQPVPFSEPTSIELEPAGTLLLVENSPGRVLRVDPQTGRVTAVVSSITRPYAITRANRVVRLSASGARIGFVGPVFGLPYDVETAAGGVAYVLEAGPVGWLRRVAADGTVTTVSRR